MEPITPEQQEDINSRVEEFKKRHLANVEELMVDFVHFPQYVQIGPAVFGTQNTLQIVDKKYAPIPSPLMNDGGEAVEA